MRLLYLIEIEQRAMNRMNIVDSSREFLPK